MAKKIILNGLEVFLLPQKGLYIPSYEMLVISDWHLGKLNHFRRSGFFVPSPDPQEEFDRLNLILNDLQVKEVVFLGDLFHSSWNEDWEKFKLFVNSYFHKIDFTLTKGNHDILADHHFLQINLKVKEEVILSEGVILSHEPINGLPAYMYNIVGHIHPGCLIETKGRQSFKLPCFHLENRILTMPAFGKFTGLYLMEKSISAKVFAIVHDAVIEV